MADLPLPGRDLVQPPDVPARQARRVLLTSLVVTAALFVVPGGGVIGYPLLLLSTFVHEMGHGLAAELVGGDFVSLRVFGDGSGVAFSATDGGAFKRAIIAGGGLVGPAIAAALGFTLGRRAHASRLTLLIGSLLLLVSSLLWVRNVVGWLVAVGLIVLSLGIGLLRNQHWSQLWLVFLSVQLGLSVF
ncbi:MAG TPA: M50 family metallopeptidase, partial [Euzebya sp.]|nr:M50 family metallopeptidase [Euzebya sp.]